MPLSTEGSLLWEQARPLSLIHILETINELEPTRLPEPSQEQQEAPEEEPENLDPDSGKSEGVHDTLDHGGLQSFLYLFSLPLRIRFSCHKPSPPYIKYKIKK